MAPAQLLIVAVSLAGALMLSECVLRVFGLHQLQVRFPTWAAGVVALAVAARWADHATRFPDSRIHLAAVAVASLLTCMWLNDHTPVGPTSRPAPVPTRPGAPVVQ